MNDIQPTPDQGTLQHGPSLRARLLSPRWRWTLLVGGGAFLVLAAWLGFGRHAKSEFDLRRHIVPLEQIVEGGPIKDGIPAILSPRFVSANDAPYLEDHDRVLGLSLRNTSKAYPIKILNWHEVVNDVVDGKEVLITYCPLCGTGIAFDAHVSGVRRTFGVSGLIYQSNVLLYDHQTESLWSQIGMRAVAGPLTGETLRPIFLEHTTWADWRMTHPDTLVLSTKTGSIRNYERDPYTEYAENPDLFFDTTHFDPSYHPKEWVVGIEHNGLVKAYPFTELKKADSPVTDELHGETVTLQFNSRSRSASVIDAEGKPIPSVTAFWFAWYAFHPSTKVFRAK